MTTREQLTHERLDALYRLICDDGTTPAGEICPKYAAAVRGARDLDEPRRLAEEHAKGKAPPQERGNGGSA